MSRCLRPTVPAASHIRVRAKQEQPASEPFASKFARTGRRAPKQSNRWAFAIGCAIFLHDEELICWETSQRSWRSVPRVVPAFGDGHQWGRIARDGRSRSVHML